MKECKECGMMTEPGEFHPFLACLAFKACGDAKTVRENLEFVRNTHADDPVKAELVEALEEAVKMLDGFSWTRSEVAIWKELTARAKG